MKGVDWHKYVAAGADAVRRSARSRRRIVLAAIGVVVLAAGATAIVLTVTGSATSWQHASHDSTVVPRGWQTTDWRSVAMHHPPTWGSYWYAFSGSLWTVEGYLSTEHLHMPCEHTERGVVGTCGPLLRHLAPNGVLVSWMRFEPPNPAPIRQLPGTPVTVAGRAAKLRLIAATWPCSSYGGKSMVTAAIGASADPASRQHWYAWACLGPKDRAINQADVLAMLTTATLRYR